MFLQPEFDQSFANDELALTSCHTDFILWLRRPLKLLQICQCRSEIWESLELVLTSTGHAQELAREQATDEICLHFGVANCGTCDFPSSSQVKLDQRLVVGYTVLTLYQF